MPKKPNFLGGMQNYNPNNGEYEPNLVGSNGKVVKDADGDGVSHESKKKGLTFEKAVKGADNDVLDSQFGKDTPERKLVGAIKQEQDFNDPSEAEHNKAEEKDFNSKYDLIFDEDYQRSYGIPKFQDESDIKTLNDIVEKAMENGGDEGSIEISNNAMERLEELVEFTPEEQDKLASGTGEEIMEILRSKEKVSSGRDKELNDMIGALDKARSPEEKHELEEGIIQREDELKRSKLPKYEEGKPGVDYDFYDDGTFTIKSRKTAHSSFEEPSVAYNNLGRFYGIDLEKVIHGKGGYEEVRDKTNFGGDIIYSESEWDKFEDWFKKNYGVDLEQIRKEKFEEYKKSHEPMKRFDWWK